MASPVAPRRSSARLHNRHGQAQSPVPKSPLSALVERDETPNRGVQPNISSIMASAPAKTATMSLKGQGDTTPSARIKPSSEEMHPAHHHSIAKKRESANRTKLDSPHTQLLPTERKVATTTSIPIASPAANPFSSPTFEFRFHRPSSDLSSEAQRLMGEVREQAAKIKSHLSQSRDEEASEPGARTLANPKGKIGRFSDIHMDQFKKMTSIANHPSSFRADPLKLPSPAKSLKRSNSRAALDKDDNDTAWSSPGKTARGTSSEAPSSPTKRIRASKMPAAKQPTNSNAPSSISTPTKASLARSASAKAAKTTNSKIPALMPSTKSFVTPPALKPKRPNTDGKLLGAFSSKLTSVRSILRRPQLKFSDDPAKIAAGTHVSTPQKVAEASIVGDNLKDANAGVTPGSPSHRKEKHVNFSSSPAQVIRSPTAAPTPTPSKSNVKYPTLPDIEPGNSSPTRNKVHFQSGAGRVSVSGPVDFTFRAGNAINFSPGKTATPTIRQVHPIDSGAGKMPLEFPSVPHGLSNKKRKRESPDKEGVSGENKENAEEKEDESGANPAKKAKRAPRRSPAATSSSSVASKAPTSKGKSAVKGKGKGILSMSRLNALARPKNRG